MEKEGVNRQAKKEVEKERRKQRKGEKGERRQIRK